MTQFSPLEYDVRTRTAAPHERQGRPTRRRRPGARHAIAHRLHRLADAIDGHRLTTAASR